MRISDWSSDVCSSDLAVSKSLNERFGNGDEIAAGCAADMTIKDQLQTVVDRTVAKFGKVTTLVASPTVRPFFGSSLDTPDEELAATYLYVFKSRFWIASKIGRASCRESVCPSG